MDNWFVQGLLVGLVVFLAGTGLLAISGWAWKFLKGPIDHFDEQLRNWSPDDIKLLSDHGYRNISRLRWVAERDISNRKHNGYTPVRIGRIPFFTREVQLPRKSQGNALLMRRP